MKKKSKFIIVYLSLLLLLIPSILFSLNNKWAAYFKKTYITAYSEFENEHWLGTKCGLIHYNSKTKQTDYYFTNSDTTNSKYNFKQILIENTNSIWIILENEGIAHFDNFEWHIYNTSNSFLKSNNIIKAAIAPSGRKWFLANNGIYSFKDGEWELFTKENTSALNFPFFDIAVDNQEQVWLSGSDFILQYSNGEWREFYIEKKCNQSV